MHNYNPVHMWILQISKLSKAEVLALTDDKLINHILLFKRSGCYLSFLFQLYEQGGLLIQFSSGLGVILNK